MSVKNISSAILGVGVDDTTIDLFESQYPVPTGVSYNSYVYPMMAPVSRSRIKRRSLKCSLPGRIRLQTATAVWGWDLRSAGRSLPLIKVP